MKIVNYLAKPTKAVAVVINLTDGVVLSGNVFIPTQWRITDVLNDERGFLPMQTTDGAMIAIAKSSIKQVTLPQAETKVYSGRDPYRILGVPQGTPAEDIKAAYHNLCKINHPDLIRSMGLSSDFQELASRNMARINAAYAEITSALNTLAAVRHDRPKKQTPAGESLPEREERFRSLVEQEPAAIFVVDEQMNLTYVNGHFLQAQGFEQHEVIGRPLTDFVRHGDQPGIIRAFGALRSGEISSHVTAGILRKDGSYIEMLGHGRTASLDGKPAIIAVTIDITEHLQAEEALREEENRFLYIVEENAGIAYVSDADGNLAYINRGFETVSGYTREEVIGSPVSAFIVAEAPAAAIFPENEQRPPLEVRLKRKHGDPAVVLMHRSLVSSDDRPVSIGVGVDITEKKKTDDILREEHGKFRGLVEQAVAGIYVVGEDGNIIYINPQFAEILGVQQEEVVGRPFLDFIADEDPTRIAPVLAAGLAENSGRILTQLKRQDGGVVDVLLQSRPTIHNGSRAVAGIVVDITGLKDTEKQLREEKNRFLSLTEQAPAALLVVDEQMNLAYANSDFLHVHGFESQEVIGHHVIEFLRECDRPEIVSAFAALISGEMSSARVTAGIMRKDGSYVEMLLQGRMTSFDGKPAILAAAVDITDRVQAEERLRTDGNRFRSLTEQAPAALLVVDAQRNLAYANSDFLHAHGFEPREVIGHPMTDFLRECDRPEFVRAFAALESGEVNWARVTAGIMRKDGSYVEMMLQGRMTSFDGKPAILAAAIDITDRLQAEERLRADENRLAADITELKGVERKLRAEKNRFLSLAEQAPAVLFVVDEQMNLAYANSDFLQAYGLEPQEVIGFHVTDFLRECDRPEIVRAFAALTSGELGSARVTAGIMRKDGSYAEMLVQGRMASFDEKPAILAAAVDITDRLEAEAKLRADENRLAADVTELERAERKLREENNRFLSLIEQAPAALLVVDEQMHLAYANSAFLHVHGFEPQEVIGHHVTDFLRDADRPEIARAFAALRSGEMDSARVIAGIMRKDGSYIEMLVQGRMASFGEKSAILAAAVDITDRLRTEERLRAGENRLVADITELKRAERKLREEEGKFRTLVEQNVAGTYVVGEDGKMVYANPGFEKLCGYPLNELIGRPLPDFIADEDKELVASALAARQDGQAGSTTVRLKRKDGALIDVLEQGTLIRYDGAVAIIGTAIDVGELKRAEEEEREGKNRFRAAMQAAPDAILLYDCDLDRIIDANKAAERLFGCPGDEIVKHGPLHFCSAEQPEARPASESFTGYLEQVLSGSEVRYDARILNSAGQERLCEVTLARLPNGSQKLLRASFIDVTEQRSAERALRTLTCGTQAVVRATDENELLRSICRVLAEVGEYHIAWYGVPQRDEAKSISPVAWAGNVQDALETIRFSWSDSPDNPGPWGLAVNTGQPQVVQDIAGDPTLASLQESATRYGVRSYAVLPVKVEWESLFGILVVCSQRAHSFDAASLGTLEELANDVAHAISTMRLRGERQKSLARLLSGMESTIQSLATTAELRDPVTSGALPIWQPRSRAS